MPVGPYHPPHVAHYHSWALDIHIQSAEAWLTTADNKGDEVNARVVVVMTGIAGTVC